MTPPPAQRCGRGWGGRCWRPAIRPAPPSAGRARPASSCRRWRGWRSTSRFRRPAAARPRGRTAICCRNSSRRDGHMPPDRRCRLVYTAVSAYILGHASKRAAQETAMDDKTRTELEAAAFRRLVAHLQERADVQNIDLMNLAGFCRNCLSRWYREEAGTRGIEIADPKAREIVYGMPYDEWKAKHQKEASGDQKKAYDKGQHKH